MRFIAPVRAAEEGVVLGSRGRMLCPDGTYLEVVAADWAATLMDDEVDSLGVPTPCLWWAEPEAEAG